MTAPLGQGSAFLSVIDDPYCLPAMGVPRRLDFVSVSRSMMKNIWGRREGSDLDCALGQEMNEKFSKNSLLHYSCLSAWYGNGKY